MIVNSLIFLAGLAIYAGYGLSGLAYILAVTGLSYLAGRLIPKHPWVLWISVMFNVVALLVLKLQPLTGMEFMAPLGIS